MKKFFAQAYIWILLILLYSPLVFIAVFSFTEAKTLGNWTGFSINLYSSLFSGDMSGGTTLIGAAKNTLIIALIAAAVSTILGTVAAIGIFNLKGKKKQAVQFLNNIPMLNPDIITGVSLFLLFASFM
jgi:ABC-type spermidine/putrescine transport system, permease component II